mmetsp:Transcript_45225/g.112345  ORF Transcript_45225/g.112345 Transcript_45225/m.112345 type:complete len:202 (-) Transcript_45225:521-1126(-)
MHRHRLYIIDRGKSVRHLGVCDGRQEYPPTPIPPPQPIPIHILTVLYITPPPRTLDALQREQAVALRACRGTGRGVSEVVGVRRELGHVEEGLQRLRPQQRVHRAAVVRHVVMRKANYLRRQSRFGPEVHGDTRLGEFICQSFQVSSTPLVDTAAGATCRREGCHVALRWALGRRLDKPAASNEHQQARQKTHQVVHFGDL